MMIQLTIKRALSGPGALMLVCEGVQQPEDSKRWGFSQYGRERLTGNTMEIYKCKHTISTNVVL